MTEAEWDTGKDPGPMLRFLRYGFSGRLAAWGAWLGGRSGPASARKLGLFVIACYRRAGLLSAEVIDPAAPGPVTDRFSGARLSWDPQTAARVSAQAVVDREV